jgi:hypothetical protein
VTADRPPILDVCAQLAEQGDLTGLDGKKVTWAFRAVRDDLRSRNEFRYPWPGQWATAPGPILKHDDPCPSAPGDGLCVAKTFYGAAQGGIPFSTMLIVGYTRRDVLAEDDHKVRVRKMYVADVVEVATLLRSADLQSADLRSADLQFADLRSANLQSANLRSANLQSANLQSANLRSADLQSANLRSANLRFADLRSANLRSADLRSADLRSANLQSANLQSANLQSADLRSADLRSADLRSANLRSANLRSADLQFADLRSANLRFATYSQLTLWPVGTDPVALGAVML